MPAMRNCSLASDHLLVVKRSKPWTLCCYGQLAICVCVCVCVCARSALSVRCLL